MSAHDTTLYLRELEAETAILRRLLRQIAVDTAGRPISTDGRRDSSEYANCSHVISTAFRRLQPDITRVAAGIQLSNFLTQEKLLDPSLVSEAVVERTGIPRSPRSIPLIEAVAHISASIEDVMLELVKVWHTSSLRAADNTTLSEVGGISDDFPTLPHTSSAASMPQPSTARSCTNSQRHLLHTIGDDAVLCSSFDPKYRDLQLHSTIPQDAIDHSVLTAFSMPAFNVFARIGTPVSSNNETEQVRAAASLATKMMDLSTRTVFHTFMCTEDELYDKSLTHAKHERGVGVLRAFRALEDGRCTESPTVYGVAATWWEPISWATLRLLASKHGVSHPALYCVFGDAKEAEGVALCVPHTHVVLSRYPFFDAHEKFVSLLAQKQQNTLKAHIQEAMAQLQMCMKVSSPLTPVEEGDVDRYQRVYEELKQRDADVLQLLQLKAGLRDIQRTVAEKGERITFLEYVRMQRRQKHLQESFSSCWNCLIERQTQLTGLCQALIVRVMTQASVANRTDSIIKAALAATVPLPGERLLVTVEKDDVYNFERPKTPWKFTAPALYQHVADAAQYKESVHGNESRWRMIMSVRNFSEVLAPLSCTAVAAANVDEITRIGVECGHPEAVDQLTTHYVPVLLRHCSTELLITILRSALVEHNIIFVHPLLESASKCVLALQALLSPLQWQTNMRPTPSLAMMQSLQSFGVEMLAQANAIGCVGFSEERREGDLAVDLLLFHLNTGTLTCTGTVVSLPEEAELIAQLRGVWTVQSEIERARLVQQICSEYVRWLLARVYSAALHQHGLKAPVTKGQMASGCVVPVIHLPTDDALGVVDVDHAAFWSLFCSSQMLHQHHQLRTVRAMVAGLSNELPLWLTNTTDMFLRLLDHEVAATAPAPSVSPSFQRFLNESRRNLLA